MHQFFVSLYIISNSIQFITFAIDIFQLFAVFTI